MTITVGTNTYATEADLIAVTGALSEDSGEQTTLAEDLLTRATAALDRLYGNRYIGYRNPTAPLGWPRINAIYSNHGRLLEQTPLVPVELKDACVQMATMLLAQTDVYAQQEPEVTEKSIKVGDGAFEKSVKYAEEFAPKSADTSKLEIILEPLLRCGRSSPKFFTL